MHVTTSCLLQGFFFPLLLSCEQFSFFFEANYPRMNEELV